MSDGFTDTDYRAVFQALPGMVALLTPELVYADVNEEFLRMAGRRREEVVGRYLFDVFPDNPNDSASTGMRNLAASLGRVLETGERDAMALQRYDVEVPGLLGGVGGTLLEPLQRPGARRGRQGRAARAPGRGGHRADPGPRSGQRPGPRPGGRAVHPRP